MNIKIMLFTFKVQDHQKDEVFSVKLSVHKRQIFKILGFKKRVLGLFILVPDFLIGGLSIML